MPIVPMQTLILVILDTVLADTVHRRAQEQPIRVLLESVNAEQIAHAFPNRQTLVLRVIVNVAQIMHAPVVLISATLESVDVAVLLVM